MGKKDKAELARDPRVPKQRCRGLRCLACSREFSRRSRVRDGSIAGNWMKEGGEGTRSLFSPHDRGLSERVQRVPCCDSDSRCSLYL
jgi:hypothetical protein